MHLKKKYFYQNFNWYIFYSYVEILKLHFLKVIVLTYFDTVKYCAVEQ